MDDTRATLASLWSPLLAITTVHEGHANGQIAVAALPGSILPDAPRVLIELWKANFTSDLILRSGVFALHLLPAAPDAALEPALELLDQLGLRSGRDEDKMRTLAWHPGPRTGSPILEPALSYIEARVVTTFDADEMTVFLADVLGGERLREGEPLTWREARAHLPETFLAQYEANQAHQRAEARRLRGLPTSGA